MQGFGILSAVLQLVVPSYALRLVRRFGAQRVGWFVALAFVSLALLYLVKPSRSWTTGFSGTATLDVLYIFASALLVIGMGHVETLCSQHQAAERESEKTRRQWQTEAKEERAHLVKENQELTAAISNWVQREKVLKESETQYRFLFAQNPLPMWIFDLRSSQILTVNQAALRQYRYSLEEFVALAPKDLVPEDASPAAVLDVNRPCYAPQSSGICRHQRKDFTVIEVELTAVDLKFGEHPARLILSNDVTLQRKCELENAETQKMAAIGRVAGGVAHHFNNLLTVISGHTDLLLATQREPVVAERLRQISASVGRGAGLTRQLLMSSGKHAIQPVPLDLNGFLRKLNKVVRHEAGEQTHVKTVLGFQLPPVLADPAALEHIIVALTLNARAAMPRGGTLTLSTSWERIESIETQQRSSAKPGEFIRLAVRDTGCGIKPEVQPRLFEPFYTTHEPGEGVGLGLASALGAVKQHGGWIEYITEPHLGTEFRIFLPRAARQESHTAPAEFKETVLLVEPNEKARGVARYFLNRYGYQVIESDSAATTLAIWAGLADKVNLLLTDYALTPELSGSDLAEMLLKAKPGLKVVYTWDFSQNAEGEMRPTQKGTELVPKPFSNDQLIDAVQACLARPA